MLEHGRATRLARLLFFNCKNSRKRQIEHRVIRLQSKSASLRAASIPRQS
jgi:hypothetical protein